MKQKYDYLRKHRNTAIKVLLVVLLVVATEIAPHFAQAAQVTNYKAIFRRLKASTSTEGITMYFKTPTGIQTGGADTITLTFSSDFVLAAETANNFDLALDGDNNCDNGGFTEETIAAAPSGTEWGVDVTGQVITFSPDTDDTLTAGFCIRIEMGLDATTAATGAADTVANGAADNDDTIVLGGVIGDTGTLTVDIITDDQVVITATVDPTITFTIDDNAIGFGTLSSTVGRWATANAAGTDASAALPTAANSLTVATNAASGWALSYNGATLTSGAATINVAGTNEDSDGTQGSEEFGLSISTNGDSTIATGYERDAAADFTFVASTTTTIASESVPTATETFSVSYLANISGATEAGAYTTTLTYIATGTF